MADALIGYTGFVGSTLLKQRAFDALYRSTNIAEVAGGRFGTVVCAAAPAQKWIANREPAADKAKLEGLMHYLGKIECETFVLVSTVDVFPQPEGVDEDTSVDEQALQPYGLHRRQLETFVERRFRRHLIVRLPGLVGPGLRKNAVYDLKHDNNVAAIDSRAVYQFYPMANLWFDLEIALRAQLPLLHLTAAPLSMAEVAREGFARTFERHVSPSPARYDMRSLHAALFGGGDGYQYGRRESLLAIRAYAQSS